MSWQTYFPVLLKNVHYIDIVSSIYFAFNHLLSFLLSTCTPQIFFCHSFAPAFFELSTTFTRKVDLVVEGRERYSQAIVCSFPGNLRVFRDVIRANSLQYSKSYSFSPHLAILAPLVLKA